MTEKTTLELYKENMKFSAGHFTIFSATQREPLHGHNYNVYVAITTEVQNNGLNFDYRHYKQLILSLCKSLNQTFLLPAHSEFLRIEAEGDYYYCYFNDECLHFLTKDTTILPLSNITVEELSRWFIIQLTKDTKMLQQHFIQNMLVKVFSAPGQSGSSEWREATNP